MQLHYTVYQSHHHPHDPWSARIRPRWLVRIAEVARSTAANIGGTNDHMDNLDHSFAWKMLLADLPLQYSRQRHNPSYWLKLHNKSVEYADAQEYLHHTTRRLSKDPRRLSTAATASPESEVKASVCMFHGHRAIHSHIRGLLPNSPIVTTLDGKRLPYSRRPFSASKSRPSSRHEGLFLTKKFKVNNQLEDSLLAILR